MTPDKNIMMRFLMISSIVLLVALQVLWLQSSYHDAAEGFRKETNMLFRNTVFSMHDSIIQRSIEPLASGDSIHAVFKRFGPHEGIDLPDLPPDSADSYFKIRERNSTVEVFIASDNGDSVKRVIRPLVRKMQMDKKPASYIIRLGADSLKKDSIKKEFSEALARAEINVAYTVNALPGERMEKRMIITRDPFASDPVRVSPLHAYSVSFSGIEGFLIKKITPQILFSLFVTVLTIVSFVLMYRNLRSQQKLMDMKNDFISNVTHELKTPVATVSVALEALKNFNALNDQQRTNEYLDIARNELNRLTLMTDKILKTSVFEIKGVDVHFEKLNLHTIIQQVIESMKLVFEKNKTSISYEHVGSNFDLMGSEAHLTTVLYNLLDNALKYSAENSSATVKLADKGENLVLTVRDTGIGIPSEYKKKIFEKFFRVPTGDVHATKGYGLGLSYVADVIKTHRGEITLDSEMGKGSCFIISLPKAL
jgi:two-component system, OmpR family, phosphate regulon sensor histidine kinase PhoR